MDQMWLAWIGLLGGAAAGLFGWWSGRSALRKNRGVDERYIGIWRTARAASWFCTLGAIYVLFILLFMGVPLTTAMSLGILLLVHMLSWTIVGMYHLVRG